MSGIYDEDSSMSSAISKTIKINDCIKVGKKLGINSDHITKLVKVKEHTRTWIKNIEKASKSRNEYHSQFLVNIDYNQSNVVRQSQFQVKTPLQYLPALPVSYNCSFCGKVAGSYADAGENTTVSDMDVASGGDGNMILGQMTVQYHNSLSHPYVLLCRACADKG
jgi:hypothetical protein